VQIISFEVWQNTIFSSVKVFLYAVPHFHFSFPPSNSLLEFVLCCGAVESLLPVFEAQHSGSSSFPFG